MGTKLIPADTLLPENLFIIPILGRPIFPGIFTPILIESQDDIDTINKAIANDSLIGLVLVENEDESSIAPNDFKKMGTVARIVKKINLPDGGINIFISTIKRFKIKRFLSSQTPYIVKAEYPEEILGEEETLKALVRVVMTGMKELSSSNPLFSEEVRLNMVNIDQPGKIADFMASILNVDRKEQQNILETTHIQKRLQKVMVFLKKELEVLKIQNKISAEINEKIEKTQREYFLREELKLIKQELGMAVDSKSSDHKKFSEMAKKLKLQGEALEAVKNELEKLELMEANSSDYFVSRNYLDTILNLPWNSENEESFEIEKAQKILDQDHYGLEEVKNRIIEYLSVRKLRNDNKGSIICLVGPPGVGKTSIGKSIAKALNKEFFNFSVGGMRDEAEIKGHRRTYVGAMPGKIIQGLRITKKKDPVFLIDEIDKMANSYQGDPASALLEVLDPEQNKIFRDHFLDIPFDLSSILFIVTANTLDTIPRPLLDRMEVIRLSGYIAEEKIQIAKKYLIPKIIEKNGLKKGDLLFETAVLNDIVLKYAREAGVRQFEKQLDKIGRKCAKKIVVEKENPPFRLKTTEIEKLLGKPHFDEEDIKKADRAGMAIGLAWTELGGDTLMIEAVAMQAVGKGSLKLTGQLGEVMQESANIAYSYVKSISSFVGINPTFWDNHLIHLHVPEGATPKDGPSAGITMATSLLSLAKNKTIRSSLAMTGELSLTGAVLPIGGLKEKTIAARRNKIKTILIPKQNEKDLAEIPEKVKKGILFVPVSRMEEVLRHVF